MTGEEKYNQKLDLFVSCIHAFTEQIRVEKELEKAKEKVEQIIEKMREQ